MAQKKPAHPVMLDRCPFYRDPQVLAEHAIATIVRVSRCGDLRLALEASQWLVEYAESLRNGKSQVKEEDASGVSPDGSGPWRVC